MLNSFDIAVWFYFCYGWLLFVILLTLQSVLRRCGRSCCKVVGIENSVVGDWLCGEGVVIDGGGIRAFQVDVVIGNVPACCGN
jgi:hypothetical protein